MKTHTEHTQWRDSLSSGWGPVLSGAAVAFLTFITFSALWLAIGVGAGADWITNNLAWFEFATALGAAAVGGFATGWLQPGDRTSGMFRGFASWGLVLLAGLVVGVPASTAIFAGATNATLQTLTQGGDITTQLGGISSELWATFFIFGGGAILAAIAGGAASTGRESRHEETRTYERETHRADELDDRQRSRGNEIRDERELVTSESR